jgi:hypothetical protein
VIHNHGLEDSSTRILHKTQSANLICKQADAVGAASRTKPWHVLLDPKPRKSLPKKKPKIEEAANES